MQPQHPAQQDKNQLLNLVTPRIMINGDPALDDQNSLKYRHSLNFEVQFVFYALRRRRGSGYTCVIWCGRVCIGSATAQQENWTTKSGVSLISVSLPPSFTFSYCLCPYTTPDCGSLHVSHHMFTHSHALWPANRSWCTGCWLPRLKLRFVKISLNRFRFISLSLSSLGAVSRACAHTHHIRPFLYTCVKKSEHDKTFLQQCEYAFNLNESTRPTGMVRGWKKRPYLCCLLHSLIYSVCLTVHVATLSPDSFLIFFFSTGESYTTSADIPGTPSEAKFHNCAAVCFMCARVCIG